MLTCGEFVSSSWEKKKGALFWKLSTQWRAIVASEQPSTLGRKLLEAQWRPIASKLLKAKGGMKTVGKELGSEWIRYFQTAGMCRLGCLWAAKRFVLFAEAAMEV